MSTFVSGLWLTLAVFLALVFIIVLLLAVHRIAGRKQILFDEWEDLRPDPEERVAQSVGSMVRHRLGTIQQLQERSVERVEVAYALDIPTFAQGLDVGVEMLGDVQMGSTPAVITALIVFIVQAFPFLSGRSRMNGSIHLHGTSRRLQANLVHYRHPVTGARCSRLWEVTTDPADDATLAQDADELAYRIYLDLLGDEVFKSWRCFREFCVGLAHHINYIDLGQDSERDQAADHYRAALAMERGNVIVSYNLGVLLYLHYESTDSNSAALELFRAAISAQNVDLRARADAAMANALVTRVHRFAGGSP